MIEGPDDDDGPSKYVSEYIRRMTPGALSRKEAAEFVGVAPSTFDELVKVGEMPPPRRFRGCNRVVWLLDELRSALSNLPVDGRAEQVDADAANGWEGVRV